MPSSVLLGARTVEGSTTVTTTTTTGKTFDGQLEELEIYEMGVIGIKAGGFGESVDHRGDGDARDDENGSTAP